MTEVLTPKCNAMLICDSVITEQGTNKKSLIGIFENILPHRFPFTHNSLSVYIKLTDARGSYKFRLELVDLRENSIIGRGEIPREIKIDNPLGTYELVFNLGGLQFKHEGKYEFRIFANEEFFAQKKFSVDSIPERGY